MSITLLLEKYDVSTDEGLQEALSEIEKEEAEVDEALSNVLANACSLEGRLRTASQAYTKLGEVKNDAQAAADMVEKTALLARDVSAKVRQLDLARSRVAECQRRVHDLIDLQLCSAGVEAAIKAHDYETGAAHVSRFLSMDPGSVAAARARGAADPRDAMMKAANTLREHLLRKFEEAAAKEDEAGIERLFKLFPQIGRAEEGVELLAKYLATQAEASISRACVIPAVSADAAVFADAITRVLEAAAAALERARQAARAAPGHLPTAIQHIHPHVCRGVRRVYTELVAQRRLSRRGEEVARSDPLSAEPVLAELALAHSRLRLYTDYLARRTEADAASLSEQQRSAARARVHALVAESDLSRTAHDILSHYLTLERYFLEESVGKALKLSTPQPGATSSSLVDDVFYITRKVIRRALSTGSVDGACAVLNDSSSVLERDVAGALRRWLRSPPPDPLPFPAPAAPAAVLDAVTARLNRDVDAQRQLFLAHMMEAEAGAEWSERVAEEAVSTGSTVCSSDSERGKLQQCAAGLAGAAAAFRAAAAAARAALAAALAPRAAAWAAALAHPTHDNADDGDDADLLPLALEQLVEGARGQVSPRTLDLLLHDLIADLCAKAEQRMLRNTYTRESGLVVERRARRLAAWVGAEAGGARERAARLAQAGALLALDHPQHAPLALAPAARLAPHHARDLLARRSDFKMEDIKRLKL